MSKADYVGVMRGEGKFKTIYTPSKKEKDSIGSSSVDYLQSVTLKGKTFPMLQDVKIGTEVEFTCKGKVTRIDKEGVSLGIDKVAIEECA